MHDPGLIRGVCLILPILATYALWTLRKPLPRNGAAAFLATLWNVPILLALQYANQIFHWWSFSADGGVIAGMPTDFLISWSLLWGAIPTLAFPFLRLVPLAIIFFALDLSLMPLCAPVVRLNATWLIGEAAAIFCAFVPAQLLAIWTRESRNLRGRVLLQGISFAGVFFLVLPQAILDQVGHGGDALGSRPLWLTGIYLQMLGVPTIVALSAVQEFRQRGFGTAIPYDPPRRLVTTGVYAYVANPMQIATIITFFGLGSLIGDIWVAAGGAVAFAYSVGVANWNEDAEHAQRYGDAWRLYRTGVRRWRFRFRPWHPSVELAGKLAGEPPPPARLYYDRECAPYRQLAEWIKSHRPRGLTLIPAQMHPNRDLTRLTYDPADGCPEEEGVAALARALEHIHLGYAYVGWALRLPIVRQLAQTIGDAAGGGPRVARRDAQRTG
jgi:protein-S-isoprenylcysteine O-methyltransferase Ste14